MDWYSITNQQAERRIGELLKNARLQKNMTQLDLSKKAGLSRVAISKIERGEGATLMSIIQLLRALKMLQNLDSLFPQTEVSPLELIKNQGKKRQRASKSRDEKYKPPL
ncbi:MAG: helix-turn-helix transcriptional regulator [Vicingaceae bacterium]